jgi:hypothetical protein
MDPGLSRDPGSGVIVWPMMLTLTANDAHGMRTVIKGLPPTLPNRTA